MSAPDVDDELVEVLEGAALDITRFVPGGGVVAALAGLVVKAGLDLARRGHDPILHIERILSEAPLLGKVRSDWDAFIDREFPKTDPSPTIEPPKDDDDE